MYTYYIKNVKTGEEDNICGRSFERACKAHNYNPMDWEVELATYDD